MPSIVPDETNRHDLLHAHVCLHCGNAIRREELEGRGHTTGVFLCPKCGLEGPLNPEIREIDAPETGSHVASGLSGER
jgi:predicted RNA-binding Zn-ribbon protein involved in translation (DUF1610 family)